jgi:hypothetical protein
VRRPKYFCCEAMSLRCARWRASRLDWTFGDNAVRHVVMMADAPCHGTRYHDFELYDKEPYSWKSRPDKWDRHPTRDADVKQGRALMKAFSSQGISFTFVQLNRYKEDDSRVRVERH